MAIWSSVTLTIGVQQKQSSFLKPWYVTTTSYHVWVYHSVYNVREPKALIRDQVIPLLMVSFYASFSTHIFITTSIPHAWFAVGESICLVPNVRNVLSTCVSLTSLTIEIAQKFVKNIIKSPQPSPPPDQDFQGPALKSCCVSSPPSGPYGRSLGNGSRIQTSLPYVHILLMSWARQGHWSQKCREVCRISQTRF